MAYNLMMETVVETPGYLALARKLFSENEMADIVSLLAADPKAGDVMEGTGGFRKVRIARQSTGKSGGARVVYIFRNTKYFLSPFFRRTRRTTFPEQKGMPLRNVPIRFLTLTERGDEI